MEISELSMSGGRRTFSPSEKSCLQKLVIRHKLTSNDRRATNDIFSRRKAWARLTNDFNSIASNSSRTEAQLKKCWDNIKTRRKIALDRRERTKTDSVLCTSSTSHIPTPENDPLMPIKNEQLPWETDSDGDVTTKEFGIAQASLGTASPPRESASGVVSNGIETPQPQPEAPKIENCRKEEREEELHKLRVAERVWLLKTLREQHATAQVEREKVQLEREKARFERDIAQLRKEQAQIQLMRAKEGELTYQQ